ncbi:MAG: hypothetical protein QM706_03985 [Nitrospira sp.]
MKWLKGIGLFLIANFLIYITLSFTANLLINVVLPAFGIDVRGVFNQQLLVWSLVIGFGGRIHQLGVLQADGSGDAELSADYSTAVAR